MKFTVQIDLEILRQTVVDYLYAFEEQQVFLKGWKGGWWKSIPVEQREEYIKHEERVNNKWNAISDICRMLNLDTDALISVIKSVKRWEKNHYKYDRCAYLNYLRDCSMEHLFQCISKDYQSSLGVGYYVSTGREIKA